MVKNKGRPGKMYRRVRQNGIPKASCVLEDPSISSVSVFGKLRDALW